MLKLVELKNKLNARHGKINPFEALGMALAEIPRNQIAKRFGVTPGAITKFLADFQDEIDQLKAYRCHKADLIEFAEMKILKHGFTQEKIEKASLRDQAIAFGTLRDKHDLLTGDSQKNTTLIQVILEANKDVQQALTPNSNTVIDITPVTNELKQVQDMSGVTQSAQIVTPVKEEQHNNIPGKDQDEG